MRNAAYHHAVSHIRKEANPKHLSDTQYNDSACPWGRGRGCGSRQFVRRSSHLCHVVAPTSNGPSKTLLAHCWRSVPRSTTTDFTSTHTSWVLELLSPTSLHLVPLPDDTSLAIHTNVLALDRSQGSCVPDAECKPQPPTAPFSQLLTVLWPILKSTLTVSPSPCLV